MSLLLLVEQHRFLDLAFRLPVPERIGLVRTIPRRARLLARLADLAQQHDVKQRLTGGRIDDADHEAVVAVLSAWRRGAR